MLKRFLLGTALALACVRVPVFAQTRGLVTYTGTYSATTSYAVNDMVVYGGATYISASSSNTGNTPSSTSSFWTVVGSSGSGITAAQALLLSGAEQTANKGAASGYAPLDANKLVPVANLPTYPAASSTVGSITTPVPRCGQGAGSLDVACTPAQLQTAATNPALNTTVTFGQETSPGGSDVNSTVVSGTEQLTHYNGRLAYKNSGMTVPATLPETQSDIVGLLSGATVTGETVDGVSPSTFGYLDATSSIQTQLSALSTANTATGTAAANASNLTSGTVPAARLPIATTSALGAIKPDGTSITCTSAGVCSSASATTSTSTTNVGSAFAAAVTAAGTTPTVLVVSQAVAVSSSLTVPSNVAVRFDTNGELLPASGVTVTFTSAGQIQAQTNQQIFGGSGSVAGLVGDVPLEWFGGVGTTTYATTGTDNLAAFTAAIAGLKAGHVLLQPLYYYTSGTITIAKSNVGIKGNGSGGYTVPSATLASIIINMSASADTIDVVGTSSTNVWWNDFRGFALQRSLAPTGTSSGLSCSFGGGMNVDHVYSEDSVNDFYIHSCPSDGTGIWNQAEAGWGYATYPGASAYTASLYGTSVELNGFNLYSGDGNAENTLLLYGASVGNGASQANTTTVGFFFNGSALNDVDCDMCSTAALTTGVNFDQTGYAGIPVISSGDIHFTNFTNDGWSKYGIQCLNANDAHEGSMNFLGGYNRSAYSGAVAGVYASGCSGLNITQMEIASDTSTLTYGVELVGTTESNISGNQIMRVGTGVALTSTSTHNIVDGNNIHGVSGAVVTTGITADSTSVQNTMVGNHLDPTYMTTTYGGYAGGAGSENWGTSTTLSLSNGAGAPSFVEDVVGTQAAYMFNGYFNGANWIAKTALPVSGIRLGTTTDSLNYNTYTGGGTFINCAPQTANATISNMDTVGGGGCAAGGWVLGKGSDATIIHRFFFNYAASPAFDYKSGTRIGTEAVMQINPPATVDNLAVVQVNTRLATDKALVLQGAASQSGDMLDVESSTGTVEGGFNSSGQPFAALATPASSSATCLAGSMWADATYMYVCTATSTIKRVALSSF